MRQDIEEVVLRYRETRDRDLLDDIIGEFKNKIQGKALAFARSHDISDHTKVESALFAAVWDAVESHWDPAKGVPFVKYVSVKLNYKCMTVAGDEMERKKRLPIEIYSLDGSDPRANQVVESIFNDGTAGSLLRHIQSFDKVSALVAALRTDGYTYPEISKMLGYRPDTKNLTWALHNWAKYYLKKAQKPALDFYQSQGLRMPIALRA